MEYRTLGKTGWKVSVISMGCQSICGQFGPITDDEAVRLLHRARDLGINLFDTADSYGIPSGLGEERVGKALASKRDGVFIATKVGRWGGRYGHPLSFKHPSHIVTCCHASLHRLRSDYIDLYQCHVGDIEEPAVFLEAFEDLYQKGKIRAYGISTNSLSVLERFHRDSRCSTCQLEFNVINRSVAAKLLPYCKQHNLGTLIRSPLARGILSGKLDRTTIFEDYLRRQWNDGQERLSYLEKVSFVEKLAFLVNDRRSLAQAALQFIIAHPGVTCVIPGAHNTHQLEQNIAACKDELNEEQENQIKDLGRAFDRLREQRYLHSLSQVQKELRSIISEDTSFILMDQDQWRGTEITEGLQPIPFVERDGEYWGPPSDDATAVREFERLRQSGAGYAVVGWPAFWFLEYYPGLHDQLRSHCDCILKNDRMIVFDLRVPAASSD